MEPENKNKNVFVETYAEDMAKVIENDHEGLVRKIIEGEEERENEHKNLSPESRKNRLFIQLSVVLFVFGLAALAFIFFSRDVKTVEPAGEIAPIIFAEQTSFIETAELKPKEISQSLVSKLSQSEVKTGGIEAIYFTYNKQLVGLRQWHALLGTNLVLPESPVMVEDAFLLGKANTSGSPDGGGGSGFFMILKIRSVNDIWGSLRAWEENMLLDLAPYLGVSLEVPNKYLLSKSFEDNIIENKNARELRGQMDNTVLLYVFADSNTVVIADSRATAREVMARLVAKQKEE